MPNVMAALPNIALCAMPQSLADAHYYMQNPLKLAGVPHTNETISAAPYRGDMWGRYCCLTSFFWLSIRALVAKI